MSDSCFKAEINKVSNHLDFWEYIETHGELVFEEYVAYYLKATLPGETYWLGEDVVPPHISEKYNFTKLLKGKRSMGGDIVNICRGRAVAYEVKWLWTKESIDLKRISIKLQALQKTDIDQLIVATNVRKSSKYFLDYAEDVGFMYQNEWISKDAFNIVKGYVNNLKAYEYAPMLPRDYFFTEALDELKSDIKLLWNKSTKLALKIFMHWPAATGKGSFPRLAYDLIIESYWNFKKSYPINVVTNPTLTVLKGNLLKHIRHDRGLNNDNAHIIFAGDVTKAAKDTEELQTIRSLAKVFTSKVEFRKFIRENPNKTIWIHTTVHSFSRLAENLKKENKTIFFNHIDEVHHMVQPDWSTWTGPLDDSIIKTNVRIMTSANKRNARGNGAKYSMDHPDFCNILVKKLDEAKAVELKYKRQTNQHNYIYDDSQFDIETTEMLDNGGIPLYKLRGTKIVAPMHFYIAVDSILRYRIERPERNFTKLTVNGIKECIKLAEFFEAYRPHVLKKLAHTNNPMYRRLLKAKIKVADTHNNSTVQLLKEIECIPTDFNDGFLIHDRLLGEGWDPENGWIDSCSFVSPTWSEIRIYQDINRGNRIGDGRLQTNDVIQGYLKTADSQYNDMFGRIKFVGDILEIGKEDIQERVFFKNVKSMPKGGKKPPIGDPFNTYYDEIDADFFDSAFDTYIKEGRFHQFGETVNNMFTYFWQEYESRMGWLHQYQTGIIYQEIVDKNPEFFTTYIGPTRSSVTSNSLDYKDHYGKLGTISKGEHWLLSDENIDFAIAQPSLNKQKLETYLKNITDAWIDKTKNLAFPVSKQIGVLNSKGKWPVHQLGDIKTELDEEFYFTKWSSKKNNDYPSRVVDAIKSLRQQASELWKQNMMDLIKKVICVLLDEKVCTTDDLISNVEKICVNYRGTPAGSLCAEITFVKQNNEWWKNIEMFDSKLTQDLKDAVALFKARQLAFNGQKNSDGYKTPKMILAKQQRHINRILDNNVIDLLISSADNFESCTDWYNYVAKESSVEKHFMVKTLFRTKDNLLDMIPHKDKDILLEKRARLKFLGNSKIHKGKKAWNSGLGLKNGKEKCNTGKVLAENN